MNRYLETGSKPIESLIIARKNLHDNLSTLIKDMVEGHKSLAQSIRDFRSDPSISNLEVLARRLVEIIQMRDAYGELLPLSTVKEQLESVGTNSQILGDCKLLNALLAYICKDICRLEIMVMVRNYSEHPTLYVMLPENTVMLISFLHEGPLVKEAVGSNPMQNINNEQGRKGFVEREVRSSKSIVYSDYLEATVVLDCINLFKRAVVNYVFDNVLYTKLFNRVKSFLGESNINTCELESYWEEEFQRMKEMLSVSHVNNTEFALRVAESLRV